MATKFTAGTVINAGLIVVGVDADAPPATPSPAPEPEPEPSASWVVVASPYTDLDFTNSGSVYVYDANDLSTQPTKLVLSGNGRYNDQFGQGVAASADKIVVGTPNEDDNGTDSGAVYVYDANDLSAQPTKLTAFDGAASDRFGKRVAINADKIVVGSETADLPNAENNGAVYVYDANDLSAQPTKLTAFDATVDARFGGSVAVTADKIVVGAYFDDDNGSMSGSVYVYDANDLTAQPTKLTAFDGDVGDTFGRSISASDDKIVVSAKFDDDNGSNSGSVYVFDANNLSAQPTKLTAFDGVANDNFGTSITVDANNIFVSAVYDDNDNGSSSGSVYVYDVNDLSAQPTKLISFDGAADHYFGWSVDVFANKMVVGATGNNNFTGSVYVYDVNDLSAQPTKLVPIDAVSSDWIGYSVAVG